MDFFGSGVEAVRDAFRESEDSFLSPEHPPKAIKDAANRRVATVL